MMTLQTIDKDYAAWASSKFLIHFYVKLNSLSLIKFVFCYLDSEEAVQGLSLHNPIEMGTACGTPPFTNYTTGFNGCLDYIFYEKSKLVVEQVILHYLFFIISISNIFCCWVYIFRWYLYLVSKK